MSDIQPPLDQDLVRLFDDAQSTLPSEAFVERFERRMARSMRIRLALQAVGLALLAAVVWITAPYAIRGSLALSSSATEGLSDLGLAMGSPMGWVCSLLAGAWVLRRYHVFDR
jgi:hypothetical protein